MENEKFNEADLCAALDDIELLKFCPRDSRAAIAALLVRIVPHKEALRWLVRTLIDRVNEWPGPGQVRALLATRYKPADGIEGDSCTIAGFTPEHFEAQHFDAHRQIQAGGYSATAAELLEAAQPKLLR